MQYYSTNRKAKAVSFKDAVFKGLPEDNGLYMPASIPIKNQDFFDSLSDLPFYEMAFEICKPFVGDEISDDDLLSLVASAFNFDVPIVHVHDQMYCLELFHGPTLAFKDFGARFMARVMGHFLQKEGKEINILVATSGDTGSAVAQGFYMVPGIEVTILYPKGKVSKIQEQQLTTVGGNVKALEIEGTFDDCQLLVKTAFLDDELNKKMNLSSANSINIARLLPQSLYYFHAWQMLAESTEEVIFCVPSGNFGNLCGGLLAKKMGLPVKDFIAATNANDVVPAYLAEGVFNARPSQATISNAMDVGNPSNFYRLVELYGGNLEAIRKDVHGFSLSDQKTQQVIKEVFTQHAYIMCPHTAIGYAGLHQFLAQTDNNAKGIYLGTASPVKFIDVVEPIIGEKIEIPERLAAMIERPKQAISMSTKFEDFKEYLLNK
ncbi:MAG: threonine synthase [Cyclobacteriaceae bacterium]